jgi:hypothetical protein
MNSSACSGSGSVRLPGKKWRAGHLAGFFALSGILASCQAAPPDPSVSRRDFRPDNVFASPAKLALNFRRIAVLPMAAETAGSDLPAGCAALTPVLWEQLIKTKKFEVVAVDAATLRRRTGQVNWTGAENLPPDFFAFLRREYGCDGVLFAELTTYHTYAPLAVGWRLKLVDTRTGQIVWSADELFDATRREVARAAQQFERPRPRLPFLHEENWVAINSPRQFGRYSAAALLETLPER